MGATLFYIVIAILFMVIIISNARKKKFFVKESFLWVVGCIPVLFLAIFPNSIKVISNFVGIDYAPSLLFLIGILFVMYVVYRLTEQVSLLKEQNKEIAQRIVVLEKEFEEYKNTSN
ncbi:MAG: DUF2304 domain-containing protein [Clostridium sp.]